MAFTLFAVAMGVLMQIFSRGVNGAGVADRYAKATMYAESKLAVVGPEAAVKEGVTGGKFEDEDFSWQLSIKPYQDLQPKEQTVLDFEKLLPSMLYEIESKVTFQTDDKKERSVVLTTLQLAPRQPL